MASAIKSAAYRDGTMILSKESKNVLSPSGSEKNECMSVISHDLVSRVSRDLSGTIFSVSMTVLRFSISETREETASRLKALISDFDIQRPGSILHSISAMSMENPVPPHCIRQDFTKSSVTGLPVASFGIAPSTEVDILQSPLNESDKYDWLSFFRMNKAVRGMVPSGSFDLFFSNRFENLFHRQI